MPHRFEDAERWAQVFDDPARDAWQQPDALVAALGLKAGEVVADVGAGTGYLERRLATAVGPKGRVIAVDIEPDMVQYLAERAAREGTPQVEARLGAPSDPKLGPAEVDVVLLVDTYHHVADRVAYFTALKSSMKPGGRLVVVDFRPDGDPELGPPAAHRMSAEQVAAELAQAGWRPVRTELLPQQYLSIFAL
jgi:ubiquinone/menaquinone biosynthesis C-methylase UbiE